jgi:hypothetical protein
MASGETLCTTAERTAPSSRPARSVRPLERNTPVRLDTASDLWGRRTGNAGGMGVHYNQEDTSVVLFAPPYTLTLRGGCSFIVQVVVC